jgi:fructose-bisphosphate aldolase class I
MDKSLSEIANALVAKGKGILAADESTGTIKKRFDAIGIESNPETNRIYRQLLFTTPDIEKFISGVIMFDETIRQSSNDGIPFPKLLSDKGILPGIKVDKGVVDLENFPGEKITEGLDGLRERLQEYKNLGAKFTKWRAVITIGENSPTDVCIGLNVSSLARFAGLSQEVGLVPVVEPEVLMDGNHSLEKCEEVTYKTLKVLFSKLTEHKVDFGGMLLKPNMILSGKESSQKSTQTQVSAATLRCFKEVLPDDLPGVVFLSGGQGPLEATENLNEMNKVQPKKWELSFSYGRALQEPVLNAWLGKDENVKSAQDAFYHRAEMNSLARSGEYSPQQENG